MRSALADESPDLVGDAELVVSELVTNAVLHGEPPVTVRLIVHERVRLEIEDTGRAVPIVLRQGTDAMTGRGLSMVAALVTDWGVDPRPTGGKVVWAEIERDRNRRAAAAAHPSQAGSGPEIDIDALLEAWTDDDPATATYTVRLGSVSTQLLLAAKAHIDNVVRELTLMRAGEASSGVALAPELSALIATVTGDFAEARTEIKRQAAAAAARGDELTDLELHLTPSAADAGERYLEALDQSDRYARSAHLLTLAPPRVHRVFRQWYVRAIVDQLRALARSVEPPPVRPFQLVLADELTAVGEQADSAPRLALLQRVSTELAKAISAEDMARIAVDHAIDLTGVETARVRLLQPDGMLRTAAWRSRRSLQDDRPLDIALDSDRPGAVVARTRKPLLVRSLDHTFGHDPDLGGFARPGLSGHVVALAAGNETLGLLLLTFAGGELSDSDELAFASSLADVLAQALRRAGRDHDRFLSTGPGPQPPVPVAVLAAQKDLLERILAGEPLPDVLGALVAVIDRTGEDGGIGSIMLLDDDGRHLRRGAAPSLPPAFQASLDGLEIGPAAGSCGTAAFTGRPVIVEDIATDPLWEGLRHVALPVGLRACWCTPIVGGDGGVLGTLAVYYRAPHRPSDSDRELIGLLVQTAAVAILRTRADQVRDHALAHEQAVREELERAHQQMRFVLEATTRVAASLDSDDTLRTLANIAVPTLTDVCLIDLYDGGVFRRSATAASSIVDLAVAARLNDFAPTADGDHPAAVAVRTGRAVFIQDMTDTFLAGAAASTEHYAFVRLTGAHSCISVPLAARGRTLGAMTLVLIRPGRQYTEADVATVEDLARRVSLAVDNTHLYEGSRDAERRLALVARAGVTLTSSLDLDTVVARLCELVTGDVADFCEVHVRRAPGQWWRYGPGTGIKRLVRTDRIPAKVQEAIDHAAPVSLTSAGEDVFTALQPPDAPMVTSVLPLLAHGEVVGVIVLATAGEASARLPADTVQVIVGRAALAIDNALLYEQERSAAEILQRSLLPQRLAPITGLQAAARYLPAGARNEIGGDWYDLFPLGADRVGVVMGDVMGRGIPAASIMGQLRNGLRMLALQDTDPAAALTLLNRMLGAGEDAPLATVTYGVIDIPGRRLSLANAGHLPPVLLRATSCRYLDQRPGLPLGAMPDPSYTTAVHALAPGDVLIMYTDGLIEQRDRSLEEGLDLLLAVAGRAPIDDPDGVCDLLLDAFRRDSDEDDTATLVLRLEP